MDQARKEYWLANKVAERGDAIAKKKASQVRYQLLESDSVNGTKELYQVPRYFLCVNMSSTRKRNRNVLPIETKIQIITSLEKGETGSSIAKIFNVGKATISDIKSKEDIILKFASNLDSEHGSKRRKAMKNPKDKKIRRGYVFVASGGWLKNFKSRHGIRELEVPGESLSGDTPAAQKFKETFLALLGKEGYSPDDVYNADETGLYWKSLPHKSLASNRETAAPDFKVSKERVTVMATANANGSHLLPPLMIGKAKNPRCFKNVTCLPLCYRAQKSAWMNCEIFLDWYTNEFISNVKKFRQKEKKTGKVLLLLDNAPSRPGVEKLNAVDENFDVIFLPPNVTTLIQPMDQGVKEKLKKLYKKQVLRCLLLAEDEESVVAFSKRLNLKDRCYMVADAWNTFSQDNIKKPWNRLLGERGETETTDVDASEDLNEIVDMFQAIPGFSSYDKDDAQMWLENDNDPGFQILNDDEIVSFMQEEEKAVTDDEEAECEDGEESRKSGPSHEEAFTALKTAMSRYEQQEESCPTHLLLLKRMCDLTAKKTLSNLIQKPIHDYFL
ncbi:jerky protein homolog-like [Protopterus annectens]|uniref:jerky protein homolog-like n=1 Tax=Protopterus annectens TaxID=7888 RepID=UPI001CFBB422|nr:jerky protein homolog-like [Protopterus annectens]